MTLPPVLDVETAAQLLRCEPSTVRERLRQGDLPGVKLGTDWVLPSGALLQRLDELALEESARRRAPPPAPQAVALRPVPGKAPRRPPTLPALPVLQPATQADDDVLLRQALTALERVTTHFTRTPSTLADSEARGEAHKAMDALRARLGDKP